MSSGAKTFFAVARNLFFTVFVGYVNPEERLINTAGRHSRSRRQSPLGLRGEYFRYF